MIMFSKVELIDFTEDFGLLIIANDSYSIVKSVPIIL